MNDAGDADELDSNWSITPLQEGSNVNTGEEHHDPNACEECNTNANVEDHNPDTCDDHNMDTHEENCNTDTNTHAVKCSLDTPQNDASLQEDTSHPSTSSCTKHKCPNLMMESEFTPKKAWRRKISGKYNIVVL